MDRVTDYAEKVAIGDIRANKLHRLACERHLKDLERQGKNFKYSFDKTAANNILDYAETLTIAEGYKPEPVKLIPSQAFDLGCTFGWVKQDGKRRFRRRYKSVARQNGKTFENGIMGTYIGNFSQYRQGKLFTVATKKRQARLAWEEMKKFIQIDPDLQQLFSVKDYASRIECLLTGCTIEALSKEAGLDDGFRSIYASIDEIHQHKDNTIYKAIYNGTRRLQETLISMITTRGKDINSFCKEFDDYAVNVLNGTQADDLFVDIYCIDEGDDIFDIKNVAKANPYLITTPEGRENLETDIKTAKDMGNSELSDYIVKCCNLWNVRSDEYFLDFDKFKAGGKPLTIKDFCGCACYVGIDLSSGGDLTTITAEFSYKDGVYWFSHSFMPRGRFNEHILTDLAPYDVWEQQGLLTVTGGSSDYKNDYGFIIQYLHNLQEDNNLQYNGIGYDPHNADGFLKDLENFGCPLLAVTQSARFLNDATVDLQLINKSGKLYHNSADGLLQWSIGNAKIVKNSFGEVKIDKEPGKHTKRIDPCDAAVDAHTARMKLDGGKNDIDREKSIEKYMKIMGWS